MSDSPEEPVIECRSLWKVFGTKAEEAMQAIRNEGLGTVKSTLAGVLAAELPTGTRSKLLDEHQAQPGPKRLPPAPFASLGINSVIRWQELRAGREG